MTRDSEEKGIICADCGHVGPVARPRKKGSGFVERMLWVTLFFPGIFYTLWRKQGRPAGCYKCGSKNLVPFDSPEGDAILRKSVETGPGLQKTRSVRN
jgi:hypothetical protein